MNAFLIAATVLLAALAPLLVAASRWRPIDGFVVAQTGGAVGVLVMRTTFDRLHYSSAATTVPALLILAAVLVREHVTAGGLEAIAAVGFMFLLNPAVVLATAMAIRRAEEGEET